MQDRNEEVTFYLFPLYKIFLFFTFYFLFSAADEFIFVGVYYSRRVEMFLSLFYSFIVVWTSEIKVTQHLFFR